MATLDEVRSALSRWEGCVSAAAEELGMRRTSLYDRIKTAGIDIDTYRRNQTVNNQTVTTRQAGAGQAPDGAVIEASGSDGNVNSDRVTTRLRASNFSRMEHAVVDSDTPIRTVPMASRKTVRLQPEQMAALRSAKLNLGAKFQAETNENVILQQFFDEHFSAWLAEKLNGNGKKSK